MRSRAKNPFTTITTAGLLLPVDLLTRLIEGDPDLKGLSPKDYHLRSSERLNEAAARAWNECLACWKTFRKKFAALPASDAGTTVTRDEWLLPLFQELGYGRLQAKKAIEIEGKEYPISHGWENHVPIHLLSARYPLDRRTPGVSGAATRAPYSLLQEMLNRSAQHRWGFVSNGLSLFLLRDNAALARAANVEFDLEAMMDGEIYSDFMLLFLLCHQSRIEILGSRGGDEDSERANPEDCWLEKWANLADSQGTRAREKLRDGVEAAIKALGAGFLTTKGNNTLRERLRTGELSMQDYYRQLLRVVYRLLMLLVAEEKKTENGQNLFHPPETPPEVRERYARFYSIGRIRSLAYERRGTAHTDLYESLKVLFLKLREGYAPLGIPGMGSFLFSDDSTPDLDQALLANQDLLDAFRQLCYTEDTSGRGGSVRRPVDFGNLGSEELGSVYESLLELHPEIDTGVGPFTLGTAAGHERKTTGSYYTPRSLINCLLDSALDPVVGEAIDEAERMANREWRMVEATYKEEFTVYAYRRLPGFAGLAAWKANRQIDLSADAQIPQGRTVRDDVADASSRNLDSGEHRGRMGEALPGGVHSVSADSQRKPDGTGNASDDQRRRGIVQRSGSTADSGGTDDSGKATGEPGTQSQETGGWQLANSEWDRRLEKAWNETPLAIRHSLFAEQKLLDLKVCDPACGSGHFLIAAAERMATHLARLRTGDDQPNTLDVQHAKRDIIGRCIYGVDVNPMAVELCKVSLWMEALEPGKPLSFLDHHIQCGNSLLGATPRLLAEGIPDDAFKPIEGDDKKVCSELKKDNKKQRKDYEAGYRDLHPLINLGDLPQHFATLTRQISNTVEDTAAKAKRYAELVKHATYENARLLADYWCAAIVWKKDQSEIGKLCPTERDYRRLQASPSSILPHVKNEVRRLAGLPNNGGYQFFHWHLAFPDVFQLPEEESLAENEQTGWIGGFDVVLGNPPWDKIELIEKEWFAARYPEIADAKTGAKRKKQIEALFTNDPNLYEEYKLELRRTDGIRHFARDSNRFPFGAAGRVNTFGLFAEIAFGVVGNNGRTGMLLPTGLAVDDSYKAFFQYLVDSRRLISLFDFENRKGLFPNVQGNVTFACFTVGSNTSNEIAIAAQLDDPALLAESARRYTLTADDIRRINPNTRTCPVFKFARDARLVSHLYSRHPVVCTESNPPANPYDLQWRQGLFNLTSDSGEFQTLEALTNSGWNRCGNSFAGDTELMVPVYEAKFIGQYTHRAATFDGIPATDRFKTHAGTVKATEEMLSDASYLPEPRYWLPNSLVRDRAGEAEWLVGFRRVISNVADARSLIAAVVPVVGIGNTLPVIWSDHSECFVALLLSEMNAFVLDYVLRQKASGDLNFFVFKQLPVLDPSTFQTSLSWDAEARCDSWLMRRVIELTYTAWDLEPFAKDCGYDGPPFRWDEERRFQIRCELDAAYFHLYLGSEEEWGQEVNRESRIANGGEGANHSQFATHHSQQPPVTNPQLLEMFPTPRDAVDYIMDTFPIVRRKDEAKYEGDYRTKRVILEIYDQMAKAIRTGEPYQTQLNPPPGPPTDAEGNFIPMARWNKSHWPPHIHPPREAEVPGPKPVVVDPAFPSTDLDKALCACLLDLVQAEPDLTEDQNLDKVILAMQSERCRVFLIGDDKIQYDQSLSNVPPDLIADPEGKPQWRLLLSSLMANGSLAKIGDCIVPGENFDAVRPSLPEISGQFLSLVAKAAERFRELSEDHETDASTQSVVKEVQEQHAAVQAGAGG